MKKKHDYSSVQAMLAIDNPGVRQGLREALRRSGVTNILEVSTLNQIRHAFENQQVPDLMVVSSEIEGQFLGNMIRDIRHAKLGSHPFPLVVVLSMAAEFDYVRRIVDCGPDDVLLVPVSPDQMLHRFLGLARNRKPFVVTHDYVGPDRRKNHRPGAGKEAAQLVEVPNPVAAKAGKTDPQSFLRDVETVAQRLNNLKVERYGVQIRWLEKTLRDTFSKQPVDGQLVTVHSLRLADISEDLIKRTAKWHDDRVGKAASALMEQAKQVSNAGAGAAGKMLQELSHLCQQVSQEIVRCLPHLDSTEMSAQLAQQDAQMSENPPAGEASAG